MTEVSPIRWALAGVALMVVVVWSGLAGGRQWAYGGSGALTAGERVFVVVTHDYGKELMQAAVLGRVRQPRPFFLAISSFGCIL